LFADCNIVGAWLQRQNKSVLSYELGQQQCNHALMCPMSNTRARVLAFLAVIIQVQEALANRDRTNLRLGVGQKDVQLIAAEHMCDGSSSVKPDPALNSQHAKLSPHTGRQKALCDYLEHL